MTSELTVYSLYYCGSEINQSAGLYITTLWKPLAHFSSG